ncbi:WD repeat-containing protein WRAP73 isoform X3 [Punica granatum]|uniref:WD repeat-containing protein WRAP73 isoform X3 n=1 Tax=Punica granatum TaxID=22663 RepID=A0A6P8D4V9_PUNGR|nr:WD repeat-containing protein WRAP73 isoform X3 [Punica granatum]
MEFTEAYKQTGPCCFSPNARYIAVAVDYRLVIRDSLSFKVVQLFSCLDKISYIEWALDSEYILCGLYKRPMIQAWSLTQPEWTCKIDEGPAGIAYARWSPDSRHILTISDFQLRLTVWSLVNTACVHVQWPKHATRGISFTRDGKFAAICTRHDCKDYINLLSCHNWEIMGSFAVDTLDLADIEWSPDDSAIVIWDSPLEYKEVDEPLQIDMSELCLTDDFIQQNSEDASEGHFRVRYEVTEAPITLPFQKPPADKPNPKQGIGLLSWSNDSQYICTRNDSMPTALWIWDIRHLELAAILVQKDPVRAAAWNPTCTRLVLCTGSSHLYMWTPSGAYCVSIPLSQFSVTDLKWNSDGSCLLLKDKESFCCAAVPLLPDESSEYSSCSDD